MSFWSDFVNYRHSLATLGIDWDFVQFWELTVPVKLDFHIIWLQH